MVFARPRAHAAARSRRCDVIARSERTLTVIASEAKQSTARAMVTMDCFVASLLAMTGPITVGCLTTECVARTSEAARLYQSRLHYGRPNERCEQRMRLQRAGVQ